MSKTDQTTTLAMIRSEVSEFVKERNWEQFHAPKNLSMALAIEAAELMEHFQWLEAGASRKASLDSEKIAAIGEELADVFCYTMALANELGIDVAQTFSAKMEKNRRKYPAETFFGKY